MGAHDASEGRQTAVLEGLDGAFALPEHFRHLGVRKTFDKLQNHDLLLLLGQKTHPEPELVGGEQALEGVGGVFGRHPPLVELDALPDDDDGRVPLDGFELWRCTVPREEPLPVPAGRDPGKALDAFVARTPRDYGGLRRLWSRLAGGFDAGAARDAELERLLEAHPSSPAVRLLGAHTSAERRRWDDARAVFDEVALGDTFVEFLTLPAYERID